MLILISTPFNSRSLEVESILVVLDILVGIKV